MDNSLLITIGIVILSIIYGFFLIESDTKVKEISSKYLDGNQVSSGSFNSKQLIITAVFAVLVYLIVSN